MRLPLPVHGRGAVGAAPTPRFERLSFDLDADALDALLADPDDAAALRRPRTEVYRDHSRTVITFNESPDIPWDATLNPYRGCAHGCAYCYARPYHEYLGLDAGLDFETKLFAKADAPEQLRRELSAKSWVPQGVRLSGVTDPYQPIEKALKITRGCLEVLAEARNPVAVITKNALVLRDVDLLAKMARWGGARVDVSLPTLDADVARVMEPRAAVPRRRLEVIRQLADAGVPVGVLVCPVIPGLTDTGITDVLKAAAAAGASWAHFNVVRLPGAVNQVFEGWLRAHFPNRFERVMHGIRAARDGKTNAGFGERFAGHGAAYDALHGLYELTRRRLGLAARGPGLDATAFQRPGGEPTLFDGPCEG